MRKTPLILIAALAAGHVAAQTAEAIKLETPQTRVVAISLQPRQTSGPRVSGLNRVLLIRDAGRLLFAGAQGREDARTVGPGDVVWNAAGSSYRAESSTDGPLRIVEIELKKPAPDVPAALSKLDAPAVDSRHYKVELENGQTRVLRVHYDAHEKGAPHEHLLNRVVLYLNDQAAMTAGDVRIAGAATHTEENAGDQPADRIAVELK